MDFRKFIEKRPECIPEWSLANRVTNRPGILQNPVVTKALTRQPIMLTINSTRLLRCLSEWLLAILYFIENSNCEHYRQAFTDHWDGLFPFVFCIGLGIKSSGLFTRFLRFSLVEGNVESERESPMIRSRSDINYQLICQITLS